ncbi:MAG: hypothetical protein EAX86_06115 [Candidatus Heimdallarchaeota archaeon]|nr:hypothetical protein [Candidatus Heimdallarchaeota archaeon]
MQLTEQFTSKKALDRLYQLVYISSNLFDNMEVINKLGLIKMKDLENYSELELKELLIYFLDLLEYFSNEKLNLLPDANDPNRYVLCGGL